MRAKRFSINLDQPDQTPEERVLLPGEGAAGMRTQLHAYKLSTNALECIGRHGAECSSVRIKPAHKIAVILQQASFAPSQQGSRATAKAWPGDLQGRTRPSTPVAWSLARVVRSVITSARAAERQELQLHSSRDGPPLTRWHPQAHGRPTWPGTSRSGANQASRA